MIRLLSLGAGVQSSTVLLMSCRGELPKIDCAIFADTGWEPTAVYDHLAWLEIEAERHGIPVFRVSKGSSIRADALVSRIRGKKTEHGRWLSMPFRTVQPDGSQGMIRRQCTSEYKIQPIEKFIRRQLLGLRPKQHAPKLLAIEQWFGISRDEAKRARLSTSLWVDFHYPLILDKRFTRQDCINWLQKHYPERTVPRSACIGCPYRSNDEWRHLRDNSPEEWQDAIAFDEAMRDAGGMRGKIYLHRDCVPLAEADLSTAEDHGQENLFREECAGMCRV